LERDITVSPDKNSLYPQQAKIGELWKSTYFLKLGLTPRPHREIDTYLQKALPSKMDGGEKRKNNL
jgi:hypothetical protein